MKNHKSTNISSTVIEHTNHHANPSRINPEVTAMNSKEQSRNSNKSKRHNLSEDKRETARDIHINGSSTSNRL